MFPSLGMRVTLALLASAPLAGAMAMYALEGGSIWPPLILGLLMSAGALGLAWFLAAKTGLRSDWQRARSAARERANEN
jgi:hypothetical protein